MNWFQYDNGLRHESVKDLKTPGRLNFLCSVYSQVAWYTEGVPWERERNRSLRGMTFNPLRANPKNSQTHPTNLSAIAKELFKSVWPFFVVKIKGLNIYFRLN